MWSIVDELRANGAESDYGVAILLASGYAGPPVYRDGVTAGVVHSQIPKRLISRVDFLQKSGESPPSFTPASMNYPSSSSQPVAGLVYGVPVGSYYQLYYFFPLAQVQQNLVLIQRTLLVAGLALVFLFSAISWLVTRWVVAPVRQAARGAQRLSTGNLDERMQVRGADELAALTADLLLSEGEERDTGVYWPFVPVRFLLKDDVEMPNWSHGQAGIAGTLAAAGIALDRRDLVEAATRGAEHLLSLGDTSDGGLRLPHRIPGQEGLDTFTYSWCHGPTGTSLLFAALDRAGVSAVGDRSPYDWERACLHSLQVSGIPERLHPGFWDNDGRCCGTAGVGDVVLNVWQRTGRDEDLAFAVTLADAIVDRAMGEGDLVYWRFVEHRNEDPLNPARPGWMQGAAGISAYLLRLARVLEQGRDAEAVARMDTWWALPS